MNVVTNENFQEFAAARSASREPAVAPAAEPAKPVAGAGEPVVESAKVEEAPPVLEEATDAQIPNAEARQKVHLRFSELTEQRKAAEAKAVKAEADAKAAHDARVLAEQQAAELRAKYEPPKPDELGPEPTREQFVNDAEFLAAVKDYAGEKAIRERDQKEAQAAIAKAWTERQAKAKAEIPDYDEAINKASNLVVSDQVRDAILESEVGPKILHHLATNPTLVSDLAKMKLPAALLTIGRLDAKFSSAAPAPAKVAAPAVVAPEVSRAPAPIEPLKGGAAAPASPVDSQGVFHGTFAEYKAARKAGKIK